MKKRTFIAATSVVIVVALLACVLIGCVDLTKQEVEVKDAFESMYWQYLKELPGGGLDRYTTLEDDISISEITSDTMEMRHYVDFVLKWNFDIAKNYKFTRITFDVTIDNFDYSDAKFLIWHFFVDDKDEVKLEEEVAFTPNEPITVEFDFGDEGINCFRGTRNNYRVLHIKQGRYSGIDLDTVHRMNWKISNLKIYGIEK